ncbi:hypothetical protein DKK74_05395 [Bifidobacterium asteroides]|uniref:Uncharacterized protein n=1 Tax=Bifidobacterium asteroides TaxID=1684 RepID=A0A318MJA7_9BIFI|nr:hypothetical protein DKK74_05395 [Bifidobacterium asteroides]
MRGRGVGYAKVSVNAANCIISFFFLLLLKEVGGAFTCFSFALINVGAIFFTKAYIPQIEQGAEDVTGKTRLTPDKIGPT